MKIINSAKEIDILYELRCSYIHGLFRMDDISVITKDIHRDALLLSMRIGESDNNSIKTSSMPRPGSMVYAESSGSMMLIKELDLGDIYPQTKKPRDHAEF